MGRVSRIDRAVLTIDTSYGPVPVWGEIDSFDPARPLVFVVRGAFPEADTLTLLYRHLPGVDVALVHLPGMHTPFFADCSVEAFARAFDEVIGHFPHTKILILGVSTGALVAMAMRKAGLVLLIEPPLSPPRAWPLISQFRNWARENADIARWVEGLFGYRQDGIDAKDYSHLLNLSAPGVVLVGGTPLEPVRAFQRMPSLVTDLDRARISATPQLECIVIPEVGHNVPYRAPHEFLSTLKALVARFGDAQSSHK